jgi:ribonuclease BN (tRNA processing enzyme)
MLNRRNALKAAVLSGFGASTSFPLSSVAQTSGANLILLGTQGGPNDNLERGGTASLLVVDDVPYLIDCGFGAKRSLLNVGVNFLTIPAIFLTHLHDDHVADLPGLLSHQWTQGRVDPTTVYGPYGTDTLIKAALQFAQANTEIRLIDEKRTVLPPDVFSGQVIPATDTVYKAYEDDRVVVSTIENTHFPEWAKAEMSYRAISYRFDTADRSVVFSGDTTYSENLVTLAKGADIFVCETIQLEKTREWFDMASGGGEGDLYQDAREGIWNHIIETHANTEDTGRMAAEAEVELLVLNHILPGSLLEIPDSDYIEGIRKHYQGEVIVGRDGMVI